jgi:hypothetical protein
MGILRIWRGIDEGVIMAAVVGLATMNSYSKKDIVFIDSCGSSLQKPKINTWRILEIS